LMFGGCASGDALDCGCSFKAVLDREVDLLHVGWTDPEFKAIGRSQMAAGNAASPAVDRVAFSHLMPAFSGLGGQRLRGVPPPRGRAPIVPRDGWISLH
jgi:hypothetical protein